jgi:hypothetical protein
VSTAARRFAPTERNRRKPARARPKRQVVARIAMFIRLQGTGHWEHDHTEIHFTVTKQRARSEKFCTANADKDPGEDGCRWRCTCPAPACTHVMELLAGRDIVEGALPDCATIRNASIRSAFRDRRVGIMHVQLTRLGEELLRHRWAASALQDTG